MTVLLAVSDHAVIRYCERCLGWDVRQVEAEHGGDLRGVVAHLVTVYGLDLGQTKRLIARGAGMARTPRDPRRETYVPWRGAVLVVRDETVVTVLDAHMSGRQRRRGRRGRGKRVRQVRDFHAGAAGR